MAASRGASTPFLRIPRRLVSCRSLSSRAPSPASSTHRQLAKREERERERRKNYELSNRPFMDEKYTSR